MNSLLSTTIYVKSGKRVLLKSQESTNKNLEKVGKDRLALKNKKEITKKIKEITELLNEVKELVKN